MFVTKEEVKKVSHLARIRINDSATDEICDSLNRIIGFVEQLNEVDCSQVSDSVQYISSMHERNDIAITCESTVMDNAPHKECNMFVVPKVVG